MKAAGTAMKPLLLLAAFVIHGTGSVAAPVLELSRADYVIEKRIVEGGAGSGRQWHEMKVDLKEFTGQTVHLRLYQRVLVPNRVAGNAYWKNIKVE